jgi:hypothetical protein
MDCDVTTHYNALRGKLSKWKTFDENKVMDLFDGKTFSLKTHNERLSMLKSFCKWMLKEIVWKNNPF